VPAPHEEHAERPVEAAIIGAGQAMHEDMPLLEAKNPGEQGEHDVALMEEENEPASQNLVELAPFVST